uniref:Putative secreted protein n=1 Tax=Ixodes ricinus TaxID=34613 RepID=A0A6B0TZS9_IXORI
MHLNAVLFLCVVVLTGDGGPAGTGSAATAHFWCCSIESLGSEAWYRKQVVEALGCVKDSVVLELTGPCGPDGEFP